MAGHGKEPGHDYHGDVGEDYNIGTIVSVGVIGCLLCVLVIIWVRALYVRAERWEWDRKVAVPRVAELEKQRNDQKLRLSSYEWIDPSRGIVSIPVEEAMAPVLAKLREQAWEQQRSVLFPPPVEAPAEDAPAPVEESEEGLAIEMVDLQDGELPGSTPEASPGESGGEAEEGH
jgi:hypothetical protein